MDVMPVASDGDGKNENDDDDQADILQPFVRWQRTARVLVLALVQRFEHGAIVIELWRLRGGLAGNDYIHSPVVGPSFGCVIAGNGVKLGIASG